MRPPAARNPAGASILLVEDDAAIAEMYRMQLEIDGHSVRLAGDGHSALSMMRETPPDLVLLDIQLPGLDGLKVLETARRDQALGEIPVVFLTNYGSEEMIERGRELGAVDYVVKSQAVPSWVSRQVPVWLGRSAA